MPSTLPPDRGHDNDDVDAQFVTPCLQDVYDAAYRIAHEYPGGVPALAQRMGKSANTLNAKVSLTLQTHHLNLREAVHMQAVTQRFDILYAMGAELDHVCLHSPAQDSGEISARLARVGAEVGDVFRVAGLFLAGGDITATKRQELSKEVTEAISALVALRRVLT